MKRSLRHIMRFFSLQKSEGLMNTPVIKPNHKSLNSESKNQASIENPLDNSIKHRNRKLFNTLLSELNEVLNSTDKSQKLHDQHEKYLQLIREMIDELGTGVINRVGVRDSVFVCLFLFNLQIVNQHTDKYCIELARFFDILNNFNIQLPLYEVCLNFMRSINFCSNQELFASEIEALWQLERPSSYQLFIQCIFKNFNGKVNLNNQVFLWLLGTRLNINFISKASISKDIQKSKEIVSKTLSAIEKNEKFSFVRFEAKKLFLEVENCKNELNVSKEESIKAGNQKEKYQPVPPFDSFSSISETENMNTIIMKLITISPRISLPSLNRIMEKILQHLSSGTLDRTIAIRFLKKSRIEFAETLLHTPTSEDLNFYMLTYLKLCNQLVTEHKIFNSPSQQLPIVLLFHKELSEEFFTLFSNEVTDKINLSFITTNEEIQNAFDQLIQNFKFNNYSSLVRRLLYVVYFGCPQIQSNEFEIQICENLKNISTHENIIEVFHFIILENKYREKRSEHTQKLHLILRAYLNKPFFINQLKHEPLNKRKVHLIYKELDYLSKLTQINSTKFNLNYYKMKFLKRTLVSYAQISNEEIMGKFVVKNVQHLQTSKTKKEDEKFFNESELIKVFFSHLKVIEFVMSATPMNLNKNYISFFLDLVWKVTDSSNSKITFISMLYDMTLEQESLRYLQSLMKEILEQIFDQIRRNTAIEYSFANFRRFHKLMRFRSMNESFKDLPPKIDALLTEDLFKTDLDISTGLLFIPMLIDEVPHPQYQNFADYFVLHYNEIIQNLKSSLKTFLPRIRLLLQILIIAKRRGFFTKNVELIENKIQMLNKELEAFKEINGSNQSIIGKHLKISHLQILFANFLEEKSIEFKIEPLLGPYSVDFYISPNIAIEIQGHSHFNKEEIDQFSIIKKEVLEYLGYKVAFVTSAEMNDRPLLQQKFKEIIDMTNNS